MSATRETTIAREVRRVVGLLMQRPITEALAAEIETMDGYQWLEIEGGQWVNFNEDEYMGGEEHGWLETRILLRFAAWALEHSAGRVYPGDTDFVLVGTPDDIQLKRRPDVSFVRQSNVTSGKHYLYVAPDVAVEIISPSERPNQIRKKLREYLDHGVRQVWHVYTDAREISVHVPDGTARTYGVGEIISGGADMPGFSLDVSELFDDAT